MVNQNIQLRQAVVGTLIALSTIVFAVGFRTYVWKNDIVFFNTQRNQRNIGEAEEDENNNEHSEEDSGLQSEAGFEFESSAPNATMYQHGDTGRWNGDTYQGPNPGRQSVTSNEQMYDDANNIFSSQPSWRVELTGEPSSGLVNPEEEVAKYFKKPTVFTECGDTEIKDMLESEKRLGEDDS